MRSFTRRLRSPLTIRIEQRYAPLRKLGDRGLLEWLPIDPGSINVNRYLADIRAGGPGRFYLNPETHIRRGLELAASRNYTPTFAVYEPGFIRAPAPRSPPRSRN